MTAIDTYAKTLITFLMFSVKSLSAYSPSSAQNIS